MKNNTLFSLFLIALFQCIGAFAQYETTINAYVLDKQTKKVIPYANIGFVDKAIGTVSNSRGRFYIKYDENKIGKKDVFKISHQGYESLQLTQEQLFNRLQKKNIITLKPLRYKDDSIGDSVNKEIKDSIGYISYSVDKLIHWNDRKSLGAEVATLIRSKRVNSRLEYLKFMVAENNSDSLLVRINIYDKKENLPDHNILKTNIYHTISAKKGEQIVDLSPYNIHVNDDFIIGFELVDVFGKDFSFKVKTGKGGNSFTRSTSQNGWVAGRNEGVAFKVGIVHSELSEDELKRQPPSSIVLYWDTSLSMQSRNMEKELMFLTYYFSKINEVDIDVVPFSDVLGDRIHFKIKNGDVKSLIKTLSSFKHNGASDFSELFKETKLPDQYLVFTDGLDTFGGHQFIYDVPVFYFNSSKTANDSQLQQGGFSSEGYYLNLAEISVYEALNYIGKNINDNTKYDRGLQKLVSGNVYSNGIPVQGCKVSVAGELSQAITDKNGNFVIKVENNQKLSFQHISMKTKSIVYDGIEKLKIELKPKYENLNEVVLNGKRKKFSDAEIQERRRGHSGQFLHKDDFRKSAVFLDEIIRGRFIGVEVVGNGVFAEYRMRGRAGGLGGDVPRPLFVVDNIIQGQPPSHLTIHQIESISLIKGITGALRYGRLGGNGVFVIKTNFDIDPSENKNDIRVKGNEYTESTSLLNPNKGRPEYFNTLWESSTYKSAKNVYYELRKRHLNEISFYVYSSEYFKKWDQKFSHEIISNVIEVASDSYIALRTLAFHLEEIESYQKALFLYKKLNDLKPEYVQSQLDLGRVYKLNKEYVEAFHIYKSILENDSYVDDKYGEVYKQAKSEIRHLFNHYRSHLKNVQLPKEFFAVQGAPARIVFEWNDPNAEFQLQFVTPTKKYQNWTHRFDGNHELVNEELKRGVMSKEFIIDDTATGEWIINILSYDDSKSNQTFMKYTIYKNYGLPGETRTIKLIKLYNQNEKVTLDRFSI